MSGTKLAPNNAGFETPDQGSGGGAYTYSPGSASWTFGSASGIAANSSGFGVSGAGNSNPDSTHSTSGQAAFIQGSGGAYVSQDITFSASTYATFYFSLEQRATGNQSIQVLLDSTNLGTYSTTSATAFVAMSTASLAVTSGTHTLKFQGLTSADVTDFH